MRWRKRGLIYGPDGFRPWAKHSALTPTPVLLNSVTIRVYAGFRDEKGVSRIGYVDVDAKNPSIVKKVSDKPALDVGIPGTFDDNGVILGDIIKQRDRLRMYYVGFQLVEKVKFLAFTGAADSTDGGESFQRISKVPIMDRSDEALYIKAIHSVMIENGTWKVWCGVGSSWEFIGGKPYPKYNSYFYVSDDGITFPAEGLKCFDFKRGEYRLGRPRVIKTGAIYRMFYTRGTKAGEYLPGYAESKDGVHWERLDTQLGIEPSSSGWDSKSLCYPSLIEYKNTTYMFYNGNDMGRGGFGYAELIEW